MSDTVTVTATTTAAPQKTLHLDNGSKIPDLSSITDIAQLPAIDALRLLSVTLEWLVKVTGDVPPTPPPRTPTDPKMSDMLAEKKDIIARASPKPRPTSLPTPAPSFSSSSQSPPRSPTAQQQDTTEKTPKGATGLDAYRAAMAAQLRSAQQQAIDGVKLKHEPPPTPPASSASEEPPAIVIIGSGQQPINSQHGAITRKFYSKLEPPITITQYLSRLHQFCPMSTAVYLATSLYIHRLAIEQRTIPVTRRNVHRLVLAGLRVASKSLEDLAYPHAKVARVGGVSESELARLEISFCFLAGFELVIGREGLTKHWESLRDGRWQVEEKVMELRLGGPKAVLTPE